MVIKKISWLEISKSWSTKHLLRGNNRRRPAQIEEIGIKQSGKEAVTEKNGPDHPDELLNQMERNETEWGRGTAGTGREKSCNRSERAERITA